MIENRPSVTAQRAAMRRAAHQIRDVPAVFTDPLAVRILGPAGAEELFADLDGREESRLSRFLRAFLAVRSRFAEDELALAVRQGVRQYVLLGAGLDTFAYRNPHPGLHVFEVDHPDTQAWKRLRLAEADLTVPETMTFVPINFERQTLEDALPGSGFDPAAPAFFAWLGVTLYLPVEAVRATLRSIVALTESLGGVVFDYAIAPHLLTPLQREIFDAFAARVGAAGEPVRSAFDPAALREDLLAMGFQRVEDFGSEALNRKYFSGRTDGLRVGSLAHLMKAERAPRV